VGLRRCTGKRKPLAVEEKIRIVHQVLVEYHTQTEVAREHRVSNGVVFRLVRKAQKNRNFLEELVDVQRRREDKVELTKAVVQGLNENQEVIDSVAHVQKTIKSQHGQNLKPWQIRRVMKEELGMSYKKIKPVAWQANSTRNLILRQQFALSMLSNLRGKYTTVINVDETWLGMTDFRRMKWQEKG